VLEAAGGAVLRTDGHGAFGYNRKRVHAQRRTSSRWATPTCRGASGWTRRRERLLATSTSCCASWRACAIRRAAVPWDVQQDFASIAPYTIEEAYEVADAIDRGDLAELQGRAGRPAAAGGVPRADGEGVRAISTSATWRRRSATR
jgi:hypothetical protein